VIPGPNFAAKANAERHALDSSFPAIAGPWRAFGLAPLRYRSPSRSNRASRNAPWSAPN